MVCMRAKTWEITMNLDTSLMFHRHYLSHQHEQDVIDLAILVVPVFICSQHEFEFKTF